MNKNGLPGSFRAYKNLGFCILNFSRKFVAGSAVEIMVLNKWGRWFKSQFSWACLEPTRSAIQTLFFAFGSDFIHITLEEIPNQHKN